MPGCSRCGGKTFAFVLLASMPAAAEVMDKEPTLGWIWVSVLLVSAIGLSLGRLHPIFGTVLFPIYLISEPFLMLDECSDRIMGPCIRGEAGDRYITGVKLANIAVWIAYLAGVSLWCHAAPSQTQRHRAIAIILGALVLHVVCTFGIDTSPS